MKFLSYALVIIFTTYMVQVLYGILYRKQGSVKERLSKLEKDFVNPEDESIFDEPFMNRIIRPGYQKLVAFIGRITPRGINETMDKMIVQAGSPGNITVNRLIFVQLLVAIILPIILVMFANIIGFYTHPLLYFLIGILGFFLPFYYVNVKARSRRTKIQKNLPDMMDLIFVSVEAGLGFDMALKRTTEKMPGPLSVEINRALDEINKGRRREDALRDIYKRTGVDDISSFITAVIQSEQLGSNITNMLRVQSSSLRQKRRQSAEQAAMKVPVKMLFPLIFLMLPALFVVILGPAIIRIIAIFSDMF